MNGSSKTTAGLSPSDHATRALSHFLTRVRDHSAVGWYCGYATETFSLATDAFAALTNQDASEVRAQFAPRHASNPYDEKDAEDAEPGTPRIQLTEDEIGLLDELAEHHDVTAEALSLAAANTRMQQGHGLFLRADKHSGWGDELRSLAARGRAS